MPISLAECLSRVGPGVWRLSVWVCPSARKNEVLGVHDGRLKLKIAAPAADNKANEATAGYVADLLGLRARQVRVERGGTSRRKILRVESTAEPAWADLAGASGGENPNQGSGHHGATGSGATQAGLLA